MNHAAIRDALAHRRLHPALTEPEVAAFERHHAIALPRDYRGFLLHVGNGGAGPHQGIFRLGEVDHFSGCGPWSSELVSALSTPFPFTEPWNDLTHRPYADGTSEDDYHEHFANFENSYWFAIPGGFPICNLGHATRVWLAVTGPEAGHLWLDDRSHDNGFAPLSSTKHPRLTFSVWYADWLEGSIGRAV